jgi:hypothetical protein
MTPIQQAGIDFIAAAVWGLIALIVLLALLLVVSVILGALKKNLEENFGGTVRANEGRPYPGYQQRWSGNHTEDSEHVGTIYR